MSAALFTVIDTTHVGATIVAIDRALFEDHATLGRRVTSYTLLPDAATRLADTHTPCKRPFQTAEGRTIIWTPNVGTRAYHFATTEAGHVYRIEKKK